MRKLSTNLLFLLFVLISTISYGQNNNHKVTIEDTPNANYEALKKKFFKLSEEYSQIWDKYKGTKYQPLSKRNGMSKKELEEFIVHEDKVLFYLQESGLTEKCEEINEVKEEMGEYTTDWCRGINDRIKFLNGNIAWAKKEIKYLDNKKGDELKAEIDEENKRKEHENEINQLDNEISELDAQLASGNKDIEEYKKQHKSQTLDDFLAANHKRTKTATNDFLAHPSSGSNTSDDFLAGSSGNKGNSDDFLAKSASS